MPFLQLTLHLGSADPEPYEDALLEAGATSITLEDAADDPVLEPAPGTTPLWPTVRLKTLFDAQVDRNAILEFMSDRFGALPTATFEDVADRIWEREWLKDFRPMQFGRRLWICPAGMRPVSSTNTDPPVFIDLDPGLAFGTGTHPTTALCLEWLDRANLAAKTIIDYGCGSGVLAIAALKLGARTAIGVDIDPQAVTATFENASRNQVRDRIEAHTPDAITLPKADIVLANILAEPLEQLASTLANLVVAGGAIVLSGLLTSQAARVASVYAAWFDMDPISELNGWARLSGVRMSDHASV